MTKKSAVFTLVACSIAALVLIGVLAVGLQSEWFGIETLKREDGDGAVRKDGQYQYEYHWDPEETEVSGLDVEWINGAVQVKVGPGDKIHIVERADHPLREEEKLRLSSSGGVLKVKWNSQFIFFSLFHNQYKDLVVEVPQAVAENMELLTCANTAGDISAEGFTAEEIEFSTTSGDLGLAALKGEEGSFSSTSGDLELSGIELSGEFSANTTSGDASLSGMKAGHASLNTVSGGMTYQGTAESFDANSVSAAVRGELENCPEQADLASVSGSLVLAVPENDGFEVEYSSVSGSFSSDFPVSGGSGNSGRALYSRGKSKFSFSTTSGDMQVSRS